MVCHPFYAERIARNPLLTALQQIGFSSATKKTRRVDRRVLEFDAWQKPNQAIALTLFVRREYLRATVFL